MPWIRPTCSPPLAPALAVLPSTCMRVRIVSRSVSFHCFDLQTQSLISGFICPNCQIAWTPLQQYRVHPPPPRPPSVRLFAKTTLRDGGWLARPTL